MIGVLQTGSIVIGAIVGAIAVVGLVLSIVITVVSIVNPFAYVPQGQVGVRNTGSLKEDKQIVAQGEDGVQPQLLPAGTRYKSSKRVSLHPVVVVPGGCIGVVTALVGRPSIGSTAPYQDSFGDFTDLEQFLASGGRQGVQEAVLPPGTYAIHPQAFEVLVFTGNSSKWTGYGNQSEASQQLFDADPSTVATDAGIGMVIEPDVPTLAVRMLARGDYFDRRTAYVVVSPSERIKVEWEVGVPVYDSTEERELVTALSDLVGNAFREAPMSVAEFVAKLDAIQAAANRLHFAQITEAVMLPKLVTTTD